MAKHGWCPLKDLKVQKSMNHFMEGIDQAHAINTT